MSEPVSVLIIGTGPAGLVNARTLLQDGFDVTMVTKEAGIGGCWYTTYPDLTTNSPWGSFTFSGLAMPRPANNEGKVVPARTYKRYLEDFYHYFVEGKAKVHFQTEVISLKPREGLRGWRATLRRSGVEEDAIETFDRIVLATGYLGEPRIPDILQNSPLPVHHSSSLALPTTLESILNVTSPTTSQPKNVDGDDNTVVVIGGGKSGMDAAAILANKGRKVIWSFQGPLKWFSPAVPPGMLGAGRMDILMGPKRIIDSWTMWLYHCTPLGARWITSFWTMMRGAWESIYDDKIPVPTTDPFLALPHFAGGVPSEFTDFRTLVNEGKIAVLSSATPINVSSDSITFSTQDRNREVRCAAMIAATGYRGNIHEFIDPKFRLSLGLEKVPPKEGYEARVLAQRRKWTTVNSDEVRGIEQPLIYRGVLPIGRWRERDLAVTGATRPLSIPATTYEVESHWISSLFKHDSFLNLPDTQEKLLEEVHADNEYNLARYPGIDPYAMIPSGTYFVGFNDLSQTRRLISDMGLNPWRQKSSLSLWNWKRWFGDWLDVRLDPEDYAGLGEERKRKRGNA